MNKKYNNEKWIFVIVQNPGGNEQFFGLHDELSNISYIPAFENKDDAQTCLIDLPTEKGKKYEVQAVMYEDISKDAFSNGFWIFMLDENGKIMDKIYPDQTDTSLQ